MKTAPVPGYPGYIVTSEGAVIGKHGRPLKPYRDKDGYPRVHLRRPDKSGETQFPVHRIVVLAFHGAPPPGKPEVRHIDGSKDNNVPSNLAWGSHVENLEDRRAHGTAPFGDKHGMAKITMVIANRIREEVTKGRLHREVAAEFGVCKSLVSLIVRNKIWKEQADGIAQKAG